MTAEPISTDDSLGDFVCERDAGMCMFLSHDALTYERRGFARVYVVRSTGTKEPSVLGYYTLSMYSVRGEAFPKDRNMPSHSIPGALLGHLARDDRAPKIGRDLIKDAVRRTVEAAQHLGCVGLFLHAKNAELENYYKACGFAALPRSSYPRLMVLPLV